MLSKDCRQDVCVGTLPTSSQRIQNAAPRTFGFGTAILTHQTRQHHKDSHCCSQMRKPTPEVPPLDIRHIPWLAEKPGHRTLCQLPPEGGALLSLCLAGLHKCRRNTKHGCEPGWQAEPAGWHGKSCCCILGQLYAIPEDEQLQAGHHLGSQCAQVTPCQRGLPLSWNQSTGWI